MSTTVAYVGLGIMGRPAASHLAKNGYTMRVYARRPEAAKPLEELGATAHSSPAEAAQGAEFAITNVSDTPDVQEVVLGPNGLAEGLAEGSIVIDMSTISPEVSITIAERLREKGIGFIDAPVSGAEVGAVNATLAFMCGGREEDFERAKPLFEVMGSTHVLVGDNGAGQVTKCVNQVVIAGTLNAVAETFAMARAMGVDQAKVRDAIAGGAAGSKVMDLHVKRILAGDFKPGFSTKLHLKDINIALQTAKKCGVPLPVAEEFRRRLQWAVDNGMADQDSIISTKADAKGD